MPDVAGSAPLPPSAAAGGFHHALDRATLSGRTLTVVGWAVREGRIVTAAHVRLRGNGDVLAIPIAIGRPRPDVAAVHRVASAGASGFEATVELPRPEGNAIEIRFRFDDGEEVDIALHPRRLRWHGLRTRLTALRSLLPRPASEPAPTIHANVIAGITTGRPDGAVCNGFHVWIESARASEGSLVITGWAFHETLRIVRASIAIGVGEALTFRPITYGRPRNDVKEKYGCETAAASGFTVSTKIADGAADDVTLVFSLETGEDIDVALRHEALRPKPAPSREGGGEGRRERRRPSRDRKAIAAITASRRGSAALKGFHTWIEMMRASEGTIAVAGWAFHEASPIVRASIAIGSGPSLVRPITYGRPRADVKQVHGFETAARSGFSVTAHAPSGPLPEIALVFTLASGEDIRVALRREAFSGRPPRWLLFARKAAGLFGRRRLALLATLARHAVRGNIPALRITAKAVGDYFRVSEAAAPCPDLGRTAALFSMRAAAPPPLPQAVDIVVPVYGGMDYLPRLFDSLRRNTTSPHRLIVIDDASPDPRVHPYLQRTLADHAGAILLRNERNLGFVGSVNRAVASADGRRHIALLNADVEVPPHWLERLMAPIFADARIASTTPFTNSATICSFPVANEDQEPFAGLDVETIDSAFALVDAERIAIELPTGIGFCMGLNREVVERIGLFDEKTFGRGYGEENDWCMRALAAGYRNVLVPNLYVFHHHGAAFGDDDRARLRADNLAKVVRRHPAYPYLVAQFIRRDPMAPLRAFLILVLGGRTATAAPILVIDHDQGGGANAYRIAMVDQIVRDGRRGALLLSWDVGRLEASLRFQYRSYQTELRVERIEELDVLCDFAPPAEIFYNNLVGFHRPLETLAALHRLKDRSGATLTIAIHDYYSLCPSYTLLDHQGRFCGLPEVSVCRTCLPANTYAEATDAADIVAWRDAWRRLFAVADRILCFSQSSSHLVRKVYDVPAGRIVVRPHTSDFRPERIPAIDFESGLHIGVVGAINEQKGCAIVTAMAEYIDSRGLPIRITVIGTMHDAPDVGCLVVTGPYERDDLAHLIETHGITVCLLPSVWPETFSYVAEELMRLRMPLCCFDLGAPAERVRGYARGLILSRIDPLAALREIEMHHHLLAAARRIRRAADAPALVS